MFVSEMDVDIVGTNPTEIQVDRDGVGTAYTFGDTGVRIFLQGLWPGEL